MGWGNQFCTLSKCVCACLIKNDNKFLMAKYWLFNLVSPRMSSLLIRICKYSYRTAFPAVHLEEGCDICYTQLVTSFYSDWLFCLNCAFGTGYVGTGSTKKQKKKHAGWLKTICSTQEAAPLTLKVCELMFCGSAAFYPWSSSKNTAFLSRISEPTSNINLGVFYLFNWFLCVF